MVGNDTLCTQVKSLNYTTPWEEKQLIGGQSTRLPQNVENNSSNSWAGKQVNFNWSWAELSLWVDAGCLGPLPLITDIKGGGKKW